MIFFCSNCNKTLNENEIIKLGGISSSAMCPNCKGPCFPEELSSRISSNHPNKTSWFIKNFILLCIIVVGIFICYKKYIKKSNFKDKLGYKIEIICHNGENVDLSSSSVKGGVTLFEFYANWCKPSKKFAAKLDPYVLSTTGLYLRKINVGIKGSPVIQKYDLNTIPSVWIYDHQGRQIKTRLNDLSDIKDEVERLLCSRKN